SLLLNLSKMFPARYPGLNLSLTSNLTLALPSLTVIFSDTDSKSPDKIVTSSIESSTTLVSISMLISFSFVTMVGFMYISKSTFSLLGFDVSFAFSDSTLVLDSSFGFFSPVSNIIPPVTNSTMPIKRVAPYFFIGFFLIKLTIIIINPTVPANNPNNINNMSIYSSSFIHILHIFYHNFTIKEDLHHGCIGGKLTPGSLSLNKNSVPSSPSHTSEVLSSRIAS